MRGSGGHTATAMHEMNTPEPPYNTASDLAEHRLHGPVAVDHALLLWLLQILLLDVHPSG